MSYGMNENQNFFMEGGKTTSRVTNEPGGKSSVQLGWDSPQKENTKSQEDSKKQMEVVGKPALTKTKSGTTSKAAAATGNDKRKASAGGGNDKKTASAGGGRGGVSSNSYASGSRMNTGNVITDRPSSRVTQPPGGKSSISFY